MLAGIEFAHLYSGLVDQLLQEPYGIPSFKRTDANRANAGKMRSSLGMPGLVWSFSLTES